MPAPRNRRHILVGTAPQVEPFTPHTSGRALARPSDRPQHAAVLKSALETANTEAVEMRQQTPLTVGSAHPGRYIEFEGPPGVDLKIDSLDLQGSGIKVVAVQPRREADQAATAQRATVFIPDGKLDVFLKHFEQYATELTENGQPKHKELVDRIAVVRLEGQSRWEDMSDKKISSAAIVASKQALTDVYWYKSDLRSFLTSTLSDAAILGRLDWDDYKRNIVGLAVDFLVRSQTRYQADLLRLHDRGARLASN